MGGTAARCGLPRDPPAGPEGGTMNIGVSHPRARVPRARIGAALAIPALLALLMSAAVAPALAASGDSYVVVYQDANGKVVDLPTDGVLAVVLQANGGTGYEWRATQEPSPDVIAAPADTGWPYVVSDSDLLGAPVSWVWYFPVRAAGVTSFAAALYPPGSDTPAETFRIEILVRDETGATASLTYDQCGYIVGIDSSGAVGITLDSNATTGYSWSVVTAPDGTLTADADNGTYTPPPAGSPPGAGGTQHFGWTAAMAGTTGIELAYTQVGSHAAGRTCALTVVAGAPVLPPEKPTAGTGDTATPPPTSAVGMGDAQPSATTGLLLLLAAAAAGTVSVPVLLAVRRRRDH
jgi:predicted secreted protein